MNRHKTIEERRDEIVAQGLDGVRPRAERVLREFFDEIVRAAGEMPGCGCSRMGDVHALTVRVLRARFLEPPKPTPEEVAREAIRDSNRSDFAVKYPRDHEALVSIILRALDEAGFIKR